MDCEVNLPSSISFVLLKYKRVFDTRDYLSFRGLVFREKITLYLALQ